jgi:membrane fusion protein (multidrug efflux system)
MGGIMMKKAMSSMTAPPQTVTSIKVEFSEWRPAEDAIGTLRAVRGADLALDVSGLVTRVEIESGEEVEEGDLLLELSADDDRAEVRRLEADAALAKVTFDRAKRQLDANAISKADFDRAAADLEARQAVVGSSSTAPYTRAVVRLDRRPSPARARATHRPRRTAYEACSRRRAQTRRAAVP